GACVTREDGSEWWRRERQPDLHRRVALLRLLRPGQARHQRPHPAARHRARRIERPHQRERTRPHRHRGQPLLHPAEHRQRDARQAAAQANRAAEGPGRHAAVPAVRRGRLGHWSDLQRRRRPGHPVMSDATTSSADTAAVPIGPGAPDDSPAPVGFIGLGNMGAPIARRLLSWPGGLVVCDVRAEATEEFVAEGATSSSSGAELARTARLGSVTVLDDAQVRDVVDGPEGILRTAAQGTVIAIHSTISDSTAVELAEVCADKGVHLVDAPVSGGAPGAEQGELAVMVGGPREVYDAIKPVLGLWAAMPVHAGDVGAGTQMKLARNLLHFISFTA